MEINNHRKDKKIVHLQPVFLSPAQAELLYVAFPLDQEAPAGSMNV